jgi:hypothetical protein
MTACPMTLLRSSKIVHTRMNCRLNLLMTRIRFFIDPSKTDDEIADAIRKIGTDLDQAEGLDDEGRVADVDSPTFAHNEQQSVAHNGY